MLRTPPPRKGIRGKGAVSLRSPCSASPAHPCARSPAPVSSNKGFQKKSNWGYIMLSSLCGHSPCPSICVRVCHCPAGQARVHWLWLLRRGYRVGDPVHPWQKKWYHPDENKPKRFYPTHNWKQQPVYGTSSLKLWASPAILSIILVFMSIVIGLGLLIYGPSLHPYYEVPNIITWDAR